VQAPGGGAPRAVTGARRDWPAALTLAGVVIAVALGRWLFPHESPLMDMDVYVHGARAVLRGEPLYEARIHDLPFTYSPFAAGVFMPLAMLPRLAAGVLLTGASLLAYASVIALCARRLGLPTATTAFLAVGGLSLEPVFAHLSLGQLNLLLVLMVVLDCLVVPTRWRGWLVGLAGGIKIVPAVFVLYFALKRDWPAVARSAAGFVASVAVGAALAPRDSLEYWSGGFATVARFGDDVGPRVDNQSLLATWLRLVGEATAGFPVAAAGVVVGVSLGAWACWRQLQRGQEVEAVVAIGLASVLASPISWTHHWVWLVPLMVVLAARRHHVALWAVALLSWGGPAVFQESGGGLAELDYGGWEQAGAAMYTAIGVAALLWLGVSGRAEARSPA
jgi:alpha-1,2-mannosyltransferase